jgi:hypothetical protein
MQRRWTHTLPLLAALGLAACTQNPLGPVPGNAPIANSQPGVTGLFGVKVTQGPSVLYAPQTQLAGAKSNAAFNPSCDPTKFGGGQIIYSCGGNSGVYDGANTLHSGSTYIANPLVLSPGIGGPAGDFQASWFQRWSGLRGPNPSSDYNSMKLLIRPGGGPIDLSCYRGFSFYARGNGNFGVQLVATGVKTQDGPGPYLDWNFYESVFGPQLSPGSWKQFIINFSDLQQLYGASVDLNAVIASATALQFTQESPFAARFTLDVDDVQFY